MDLEPVVGFINFNFWPRENPFGILELLFCFIVNTNGYRCGSLLITLLCYSVSL